jgi:hypothetical protein
MQGEGQKVTEEETTRELNELVHVCRRSSWLMINGETTADRVVQGQGEKEDLQSPPVVQHLDHVFHL